MRELFSGVDWSPFEAEVNKLYNLEGRGRRPKPPIAYFRAVLVMMLHGIPSFSQLVERLRNNPDLASLCGFDDPPSKMGFSRFMKRLSEAELDQELFQEALKQLKEAKPKRRGRPKKGAQLAEPSATTPSQLRHGAGGTPRTQAGAAPTRRLGLAEERRAGTF